MVSPLQALLSILHLLLLLLFAASMVHGADESPAPPPSGGYIFDIKLAGPKEQAHSMMLQIGESPSVSAMADTGSDLIWLGRDKCSQPEPIKCPSPCDGLMGNMKCCSGHCMFERKYGHGSFTRGFMAKVKVGTKDLNIGCAVDFGCPGVNKEDCGLYKTGGIVGLGRGKMSLLSQLKLQTFSFCLPDYRYPDLTSKIKFGSDAAALPKEVGRVDFVHNQKDPNKYYVNLKNIFFQEDDQKKIWMGTKDKDDSIGDMLIDSGASFSKLPSVVLDKIKGHVEKLVGEKPQPSMGYDCYSREKLPKKMPYMVLQFDHAEMRLPMERYMWLGESRACLAIKNEPDQLTLGNLQMQNMNMLFYLPKQGEAGTLAFWPGCDHPK